MRPFLFLLFSVLFVLPVQAVQAVQPEQPGALLSKAYLKDATGNAGIDSLAAADFKPYAGNFQMLFENHPLWLRLTPQPASAGAVSGPGTAGPLVLRVGPHSVDSIELYERVAGQWVRRIAGDQHPKTQSVCPDDYHCFALDPRASRRRARLFTYSDQRSGRHTHPIAARRRIDGGRDLSRDRSDCLDDAGPVLAHDWPVLGVARQNTANDGLLYVSDFSHCFSGLQQRLHAAPAADGRAGRT